MRVHLQSLLKKIVPRSVYRLGKNSVEAWHAKRIASRVNTAPAKGIHVCYADTIETEGAIVRGGAVKLLSLRRAFPSSPLRFNVLYLVSSALPRGVAGWIELAKRSGAKIVLNQNGVGYPGWAGSGYSEVNEKIRTAMQAADFIFYQTEFCRDTAWKWVVKVNTPHQILRNAVDCATFCPVERALDSNQLILLAAGSHEEPTRVRIALETLAELRRGGVTAKLILAGRIPWDPTGSVVKNLMKELRLEDHVEKLPPYRREEAPEVFRRAHILIHPKYKDPCPTVVIEAMACGLPVVGSASGGMPELVSAEAGKLLPVQDSWDELCYPSPANFAKGINEVWNRISAHSNGARSRALAAFSEDAWVEKHGNIFSELLGQ